MPTRPPSPTDRTALTRLLAPDAGSPFRPEEIDCALELLGAVLDPPPGNTYEARVLVDDRDTPIAYACFGATPMTDATYDVYWMVTDGAHRGRGLGGQLLGAVEEELHRRGA